MKAVRTLAEDKRKRNPLFSEMIQIYYNNDVFLVFWLSVSARASIVVKIS